MEQYFLHLKSLSPSLLTINGNVVGAIELPTDKISIITDERELYLCSYPLIAKKKAGRSVSYAAKLVLQEALSCSSELITLTRFPNNHIEAICSDLVIPHYTTPKGLAQLTLSTGHVATLFEDANQTFIIESSDLLFTFTLPAKLSEYEINETTIQNTRCIKLNGISAEDKQYVLIVGYIDSGYEHLLDVLADKIEETTEGEINSLEIVRDLAKHGYVEKYSFDGRCFNLSDNYTVYMNSAPEIAPNPHLIPYAFIEAVNVSNLNLARKYLDSELSSALSDQHLRTFFEDYCEVCWNAYEDRPLSLAVIYGEKVRVAKIYDFALDNNKITNITSEQ